jgi:hypothetical protein
MNKVMNELTIIITTDPWIVNLRSRYFNIPVMLIWTCDTCDVNNFIQNVIFNSCH